MDTPHPQYEVLNQVKRSMPDGNGNYRDVWVITYKTASGVTSAVTIAAESFSATNVDALIRGEMEHIEAVNSLGIAPVGY